MSEKMATVEEVLNATKETAPKGWTVSLEYPNFIAVSHPTFNDEQLIALGDINGFFSFNDTEADPVLGDMENLTDAKEIALSFWQQISVFYPDLMEKRKGITPEQLERVKKILTEQKEKDANNG
jgi:NADH pyrophosphatase NudC (nudix superfamily)